MNNELNKPIKAQELAEKELECVCGGGDTIIIPDLRAIEREPRREIRKIKLNQAFVL